MLLEGKKALITGSRRGIGRGIALALAREGCDIGLNDLERDAEAEKTIAEIEALGRQVSYTVADISSAVEVGRLFEEFLAAHGRIDILVNNPFWARSKPFLEIDEATWDRTWEVCVKGFFLCSQRAAKEMVAQSPARAERDEARAPREAAGHIISISSVHAFRAWENDTAYGVAKAAVARMTMSMAVDLAEYGIRANAIAPGYIDSRVLPEDEEQTRAGEGYADQAVAKIPTRTLGVPSDIAGAAVFLCSPYAEYVNGQTLVVDGGFLTTGVPD